MTSNAARRLTTQLTMTALALPLGVASLAGVASAAPAPAQSTSSPAQSTSTRAFTATISANPVDRHLTGSLPDGSTWQIDVPAGWNGNLVLFSHGFRSGPDNPSFDAGWGPTSAAVQERGWAVAQSSYARTGRALGSAVDDQLGTLSEFKRLVGEPTRTVAVGRSMGGLVSSLLAERRDADIDGAVSTCGLLGGGLNLNNYQLDGAQAISSLLLPGEPIKLTKFSSVSEAAASAQRLGDAVTAAMATPAGRARVSLAATLMNMPRWATGDTPPAPRDAEAILKAQVSYLPGTLMMAMTRRVDIQQVSGGDSGWTKGVDYARLLARSGQRANVATLYRAAGLDLRKDLDTITSTADVTADRAAIRWMLRTSVPTGKLRVPVLTTHTLADPAAPVEYQSEYAAKVKRAGRSSLLKQAYVQRVGHCTFTVAENLAAVGAMDARLTTGRWGRVATTRSLQEAALATGTTSAAFVDYRPEPFVNDRADRLTRWGGRHGH